MITTSFTKVKINEIVQSQIPEYIDTENPLFSDFIRQFYISQEYQGGSIDIADNLTEYKGLDFLNKTNLTGFTSVSTYISGFEDTIYVDSTVGWPDKWGLLKIDDEIITYTGIGTTSFTGCVRGFSGIEANTKTNQPEYLTFTNSGIGTHAVDAKVHNLSSVFLNTFFKNLKKQFLPGFSERKINDNVDESNFIRQAKDFYKSKGTEEAFKILFKALYNEDVEMIQPSKYILKPSAADYIVNDVLVCESLQGDPEKIEGETLIQNTTPIQTSGSIYSVERTIIDSKKYYKVAIDQSSLVGKFRQIGKTFITKTAGIGASVLSVDSTVGFGSTGSLLFEDRTLSYSSKNYTQFLGIPSITASCGIGSTVRSGLEVYSYENGDLTKPVRMNVLGLINKFVGDANLQQRNAIINVKTLGSEKKDLRWTSWIHNTAAHHNILGWDHLGGQSHRIDLVNAHTLYINDRVDVIDDNNALQEGVVSSTPTNRQIILSTGQLNPDRTYYIRRQLKTTDEGYTSDIQNTYSDVDDCVYVASNSLPHWSIDPQTRKRTFVASLNEEGSTIEVLDHNFHDGELIVYSTTGIGTLTNLDEGQPYYVKKIDANKVALAYSLENVRNGRYITAFTSTDIADATTHFLTPEVASNSALGSQKILRKFDNPTFDDSKITTVQGGVGLFANGVEVYSYKATDKVFYGPIESIDILNSGEDYDLINSPRLSVTQTGHTGAGCSAIAHVKGSIKEINLNTFGLDYLETPNVSIIGGNDTTSSAFAQMKIVHQETSFDSTTQGSIVNTLTDRFVFPEPHGFKHGEEIIYDTSNTDPIGIGTTPGNLVKNSPYYVVKLNDWEMHISDTQADALAGIGTLDLTTNGGGVHKFTSKARRHKVDKIVVTNSGSFKNRTNTTKIAGINTFTDSVNIKGHGFLSGDLVKYSADDVIGGLTSDTEYYAIKIDDNNFRVSTDKKLESFVGFTTTGSGVHTFQDPPISVVISGRQGISTDNATATPVIRGHLTGIHIENAGTDFGSTVINDIFKPNVKLVEGDKAYIRPMIENGKIDQVIIQSGGEQFFSVPDVIIKGSGVGAKAQATIENGSVTKIDIINAGIGYTVTDTTISLKTPGKNAILSGNIKEWTVNQVDKLVKYGDVKDDDGFLEVSTDVDLGNPYVNYYIPRKLRDYLGDDGAEHSPIIGWAYDGHPIYGPVGIVGGQVKYLQSSYSKISDVARLDGPPLSKYPSGFFVEDFKYIEGYGDLDEHNGRFAVTPDYPNGIYAYYTTVAEQTTQNPLDPFDGVRKPVFPYVVGDTYHSKPNQFNLDYKSNQDIAPDDYTRNTEFYNISEYTFVTNGSRNTNINSKITNTKSGSLENINVVSEGSEYNVNDKLVFDNTDTNGFGAIGKLIEVTGPGLSSITTRIREFENVKLTSSSNTVVGVTTLPHQIPDGSIVEVYDINNTDYSPFASKPKIRVATVNSGLGTDMLSVGLTTSVTLVDNITDIREKKVFAINDFVAIDSEQLKVVQLDAVNNKITLLRAQNGTTAAAHTATTAVERLERKFTYRVDSLQKLPAPEEIELYFDATTIVGSGTTFGVGIGTTVSTPTGDKFIPTRSIYIPDHRFRNGEQLTYSPGAGTSLTYQTDAMKRVNTGFTAPLPENVFVQIIDNNLVGLVTTRTGISSDLQRVMYTGNIGIGNTHSFTTNRSNITGNVRVVDVVGTTVGVHSMRKNDAIDVTLVSAATSALYATYDTGTRFINLSDVSVGAAKSVNPPINVVEGDKLRFDTSDPSLLDTKICFYKDQSFTKEFVGSGVSAIEVQTTSIPGNMNSKTEVHFTPETPSVLYYTFKSIGNTKEIETNKDITDYSKIVVNPSKFSGRFGITTTTDNTFEYNLKFIPERVGYTTDAYITYNTTSTTQRGGIGKALLTSGGVSYKDIPEVSVASTTGSAGSVKATGATIGLIDSIDIVDYGFDYPSDPTLSPSAIVPSIITLKDNFSVDSVGVTSVGTKYLSPPNFVVYNRKTDKVISDVEFLAELDGAGVKKVTVVNGGGNLSSSDNELIAVDNTNGVGIITATYSSPDVTLRLQTPPGGFTTTFPMPFNIGDNVFVENVGVSSGKGYNSADYKYKTFTISGINTNFGVVDQATISYEVDEAAGYDDFKKFGTVSNIRDIARFKLNLKQGIFNNNETIVGSGIKAKLIAGEGKSRNVLRVDSLVGFHTGDKVIGELSRSSGTIESMQSFTGNFEIDSTISRRFGWEDDSGKLSDFYQRIQDNDYYQYFAYSLKSKVGVSSWSEPVDSLAHIGGFKKHSDLLIPSVALGIGTQYYTDPVTSVERYIKPLTPTGLSTATGGVVMIDTNIDLERRDNWDLISENTNPTGSVSKEVHFNSKRFGDAIQCRGNRVLDIDDISDQFYSDPDIFRSIELDALNMSEVSAVKYYAQVVLDTSLGITYNATQYTEFVVGHDQNEAFLNTYSELSDSFDLGEFTATAFGGILSVSFAPHNTTYEYDITFYKEVLPDAVGVGSTAAGLIQKVGMTSAIAASGSPSVQVLYEIDSTKFRSGSVVVAAEGPNEKEIDEFSFLASGTIACDYNNFGQMDSGTNLGTFAVNHASGVVRLEYTPVAGIGVTVSTLTTLVGVDTHVAYSGFTTARYRIGDTELNSRRTDIAAAASPTAVVISEKESTTFTTTKYAIEIENTTDNAYSYYQVAANSYEGSINYSKFNNLSTATGISTIGAENNIPNAQRDVRATEVVASGNNTQVKFTPAPNKAYIARVAELRIDKPDALASDTEFGF